MLRGEGFQNFVPQLRMDRAMKEDVFPAMVATCGQRVFANLHVAVLGHRRHCGFLLLSRALGRRNGALGRILDARRFSIAALSEA